MANFNAGFADYTLAPEGTFLASPGPISPIHLHQTTNSTPEQYIAGLTAFGLHARFATGSRSDRSGQAIQAICGSIAMFDTVHRTPEIGRLSQE
jgi:hypothetical protein